MNGHPEPGADTPTMTTGLVATVRHPRKGGTIIVGSPRAVEQETPIAPGRRAGRADRRYHRRQATAGAPHRQADRGRYGIAVTPSRSSAWAGCSCAAPSALWSRRSTTSTAISRICSAWSVSTPTSSRVNSSGHLLATRVPAAARRPARDPHRRPARRPLRLSAEAPVRRQSAGSQSLERPTLQG